MKGRLVAVRLAVQLTSIVLKKSRSNWCWLNVRRYFLPLLNSALPVTPGSSHFSMRLSTDMALIATVYGMEHKLFATTAAELAALIAEAGGEDVASKRR